MSRKRIGHELLMIDVKLDKSSGPEVIKNALGKNGFGDVIEEVKWYFNKWTKEEENHCHIIFKNVNYATKARERLNGQLVPGTRPVTTFTLIPYPPTSEDEKLLFARKCNHGLVLSGFDSNSSIDEAIIKKEILRYYPSVDYIKVSDGPQAAIWFSDVRDRDLAIKQLDGLKMKFGDAEKLPVKVRNLPPMETDILGDRDRKREAEMYGCEVTPSNCQRNSAPDSSDGVIKESSVSFQSQKLSGEQQLKAKGPSWTERPATNETLEQRRQPTINVMLEQRRQQTTNVMLEHTGKPTTNVMLEQRGQPTTNEILEQRRQPTTNEILEQRRQPTINEILEQRRQLPTNVMLEQRRQLTTNEILEQRRQPTINEILEQRRQLPINVMLEQRRQPTTNEILEQRRQPTTNEILEQRLQLPTNMLLEQRRQPTTNELLEQRRQPTTNEILEQRLQLPTNVLLEQRRQPTANEILEQRLQLPTNVLLEQRRQPTNTSETKWNQNRQDEQPVGSRAMGKPTSCAVTNTAFPPNERGSGHYKEAEKRNSTNYWHTSATPKQRKDTEFWKNELKTYLSISKEGVLVDTLNEQLDNDGVGQIPFKKLGFLHLNHFLLECYEFLMVGRYYSNQLFLFTKQAEVAPEVVHIAQLVKGQDRAKGTNKNPRPLRHQINTWLPVGELLRHSIRNDNARDYRPPPKHFPRRRRGGRGGSSKYPAFSAPRFNNNHRALFPAKNDGNSDDLNDEMDGWDFGGNKQSSQSKAQDDNDWAPVQSTQSFDTLLRSPFQSSSNSTLKSSNPVISASVPVRRPIVASSNLLSGYTANQSSNNNASKIHFAEKSSSESMSQIANSNVGKIYFPVKTSNLTANPVSGQNQDKIYFPKGSAGQTQTVNTASESSQNQNKIYFPEKCTGRTVSQITDANIGKIYIPEKKVLTITQENKLEKTVKQTEQSLLPSLIPSLSHTLSKLMIEPSVIPSLNGTLSKINITPGDGQMKRASADSLSNSAASSIFSVQPQPSKQPPEVATVIKPLTDKIASPNVVPAQSEPLTRPTVPNSVNTLGTGYPLAARAFALHGSLGANSFRIRCPKRPPDLTVNVTNDFRSVHVPLHVRPSTFSDQNPSNSGNINDFSSSSNEHNSVPQSKQLTNMTVSVIDDNRKVQMPLVEPKDSACADLGSVHDFSRRSTDNLHLPVRNFSIEAHEIDSAEPVRRARDYVVERVLRDPRGESQKERIYRDPRGESQKENILRSPYSRSSVYPRRNTNTINSECVKRFLGVYSVDTTSLHRENDDVTNTS